MRMTIEEQERAAYMSGDTTTAALLARLDAMHHALGDAVAMLAITDVPGVNDDVIDLLEGLRQ
jgi:hypothetical protein